MRAIGKLAVIAVLITAAALSCDKPVELARLTVLITGNVESYIENCGCTSGQFGGLVRMARLARQEREAALRPHAADKGRPAAAMLIDVGNFASNNDEVTRINSVGIVRGLATLDYDAVGLGHKELAYPQDELWKLLGNSKLPLTAANLRFTTPPAGEDLSAELGALVSDYLIVETDPGYRVGIIHVIDVKVQEVIGELNGFELSDAAQAVRRILDAHGSEADYWLLSVADASQGGTGPEAFRQMPELIQIIGFKGQRLREKMDDAPPSPPYFVDPPYTKAKDVLRSVTFFKQNQTPPVVQMERLAVPESVNPDEQVQAIIAELAPQLERLEVEQAMALQEVHPVYVGYESCRACHAEVVEQQLTTHHVEALTSLVEKDQARSAACLPCHVVGHARLPGVTSSGGWNVINDQLEMRGVRCESCHGPGEYHVAAMTARATGGGLPAGLADVLAAEGRSALGLQPAGEQTCLVCHDELNSRDFNFERYWAQIAH